MNVKACVEEWMGRYLKGRRVGRWMNGWDHLHAICPGLAFHAGPRRLIIHSTIVPSINPRPSGEGTAFAKAGTHMLEPVLPLASPRLHHTQCPSWHLHYMQHPPRISCTGRCRWLTYPPRTSCRGCCRWLTSWSDQSGCYMC